MKFYKNNHHFILGLFAVAIASLFSRSNTFAWQADKDPIFDIKEPNGFNGTVLSIAIQDDRKIIVGGGFTSYQGVAANRIIRLNPDGSRDTSFNIGDGFNGAVNSIAIQDDGKIIVGGSFTSYNGNTHNRIIRLTSTGAIDTDFNIGGGFVYSSVNSIAVQPDGKILVGGGFTSYNGSTRNRIIRLTSTGARDDSFNIGVGFNNNVNSIAIQDDGKIFVGGDFTQYRGINSRYIIRLTSTGAIDTDFNIGGGFDNYVEAITIQDDGKIIVGGYFASYNGTSSRNIIRLTSTGSRDDSFNIGNGFSNFSTSSVGSIVIQNDGKIIVGGSFNSYKGTTISNHIIRLTSTGAIDTDFNIGGVSDMRTNKIQSIAIQNDGKIIVGGDFTYYQGKATNEIIRLNSDGAIDPNFNIGDGFNDIIKSIAIQDDGKIIVGGSFRYYNGFLVNNRIVRLNNYGVRDNSFNTGFNRDVKTIAIQNDGKIFVGGLSSIIKINHNGIIETNIGIGGYAYSITTQDDGKIIVGGSFTSYQGVAANRIIRLNPDGSRDTSFNIGDGFNGAVNSIAIQDDGKIIVGGSFTSYNGNTHNYIIRLTSTGAIDTDFNIGGGFNNNVNSIAIQDDGKIFVGGDFTQYRGINSRYIIRLTSTGAIDTDFNIGGGFSYTVYAISIQNDGKIIVGGWFTSYQGVAANRIIRLNPDGSRDDSFNIGNGFNSAVYSIAIQDDGKIFVGGEFTSYKNQPAGYLIALKGNNPLIIPASGDVNEVIDRFTYRGYTLTGGTLSGSTPFSLSESNGKITTDLNILSNGTRFNLPANLQFKKSDNSNYIGNITPPATHSVSTVDDKPVLSAISVGSNTESLSLTNGAATLGVPVDGANIGDPVSIYSSQDGSSWTYEKGGIVSDIDGQPYVSFTTDHFTYFAIAGSTGSFVINNDEAFTTSPEVILTISAPTATGMRFSNDGINWSGRESVSTSKYWELSSGYEEKTVYAQFIANGEIYSTSDSIVYGIIGDGTQGNITLTITGGVTECVYGTSLNLGSQDGNLGTEGYIFSGDFSPANRYCADYKGLSGWVFTIQTTDLINENGGVISGSNVFISHDVPVVQGHDSCTGHNGDEIQFYGSPLSLIEKAEVANNDKICKVDISNVKLKVDVPAYQAPGNYVGTLTITLPNGFDG